MLLKKHFVISLSFFLNLLISNREVQSKRVRRIIGGTPAIVHTSDEPVVYLHYAQRSAIIRGVLDIPHYVFRGIRYGYAPVGSDRFQRPRQYFPNGDYNATTFPSPCMQPNPGKDTVIGNEDCLFLNVFTPNLPDSREGLPVVVWIHGGGFRYGSASQYGVRHLVAKSLVVVTIQYRLGTFGFLSSGTSELPGNAALFDMGLAIQWVRNYIAFFGGNPNKIVIMGHGSGATSAMLLTLSNIAKGAVSAVVAMSGSAISHWAIDNSPSETAQDIAKRHSCPTKSVLAMIRCLQNVPAESIIRIDSSLELSRLKTRGFMSGIGGLLGSSPVVEGVNDMRSLPAVVQRQPLNDLHIGRQQKIPLLIGITKDETRVAVHGEYKNEIVSKLGNIPNFLDEVLVKNMQSLLTGLGIMDGRGNHSSTSAMVDPLHFGNYVQTATNTIKEGLDKISEVTGDVLFNLPAFLTADLWAKHDASTYLYRFEHCGNGRKGYEFLKGIPIVGNHTVHDLNETVSHGDDLSYVFDALNIDGSELDDHGKPFTHADEKVRELFTQMISDFAYNGRIYISNKILPSFSSKQNNFVRINTEPKLSDNFRFCEMALWARITERFHNSNCKFFDNLNTTIKIAESVFLDPINAVNPQTHVSSAINAFSNTISMFGIKKKSNVGV